VLDLVGEIFQLEGNCSFTINATLDTEIIGDFLRGELRYVGSTNNNPDCTPIEGCVSVQAFNAIRPPQPPPGLADAGVPDPPDAGAAP
jgi:hypothetical protein